MFKNTSTRQILATSSGNCSARAGRWPRIDRLCQLACMMLLLVSTRYAYANLGGQGPAREGQIALSDAEAGAGSERRTIRLLALLEPDDGPPTMVAIHEFLGESVDVTIWRPGQGQKRVLMPAAQLVGLHWSDHWCRDGECVPARFRIVETVRDETHNTMPAHGANDDIWLYRVDVTTRDDPGVEDWKNLCKPDAGGQSRGILLSGQWNRRGDFGRDGYTVACTSGAISKCVRTWGYKPWKRLSAGAGAPVSLHSLHLACVRAARADYCGNGRAHTREGTVIDLFDRYGFNRRQAASDFSREAGFTPDGASFMQRTRWPLGTEASGLSCAPPALERDASTIEAPIEVWSRNRSGGPMHASS